MKQQLHYHISLARLTLFATFEGLLLILMFARSGAAQTQTFNPTYEMSSEGNIQNFTVPMGVTSLTITAKGSVGGGTSGGKGATMKATFAVTPGALLKIVVGAKGHSSTNNDKYGGGGGGSFVAVGDINEANLLIAAGGGGGSGLTPGGDASTTAGNGSGGGPGFGTLGGGGGGAGINENGEDAGLEPCTNGAGCGGFKASAGGSSGNGGAVGGFGGGGGAGFGGGGGGGYTGGKGGNQSTTVNSEGEGGGGGSSYTKSGATAVSASVNNTGVGQVIIEWTATINPATLTAIPNQATCDGQTISNIPVTLSGDLSATLSAASSNTAITPTFTFGGSGANRTLTIATTAGQPGATTITVTATSVTNETATQTFLLELGNKVVGSPTVGSEQTVIDAFNNFNGYGFGADGNIYVSIGNAPGGSYTANSIAQFGATGNLLNANYIVDATNAPLPERLDVGADGNIYFINGNNGSSLTRYNGQTFQATKVNAAGVGGSIRSPVVAPSGEVFYLNFANDGGVYKLPANFTNASTPTLLYPTPVASNPMVLDPTGTTLYYLERPPFEDSRIMKAKADGSGQEEFLQLPRIYSMAFDENGQLWIAQGLNGDFYKIDLNTKAAGTPAITGFYAMPKFKNNALYYPFSSGSQQGLVKRSFVSAITYTSCNALPVFNPTTVASVTACQRSTDGSLTPISLTVSDPDGTILSTTVTSSNPNLVAAANIGSTTAVQVSLTQKANQSGSATITVGSTDDKGGTATLSFTVTVKAGPVATATPANQSICSGVAITAIGLTSSLTGTTYSWTRSNTVTVTGIAGSGSGDISGSLTNTTNAPVTVTFSITPTAGGCQGAPATATVTIPTVVLTRISSSNPSTCGTTDGSILFSTDLPAGTYTLNYKKNGQAATRQITVGTASGPGNSFVLPELGIGSYSDFSISYNDCLVTLADAYTLTAPVLAATNTVSGALSCASPVVTISSLFTGSGVTVTGPGNFVFSNVFRKSGQYGVSNSRVTKPGVYTVTVYNGTCTPAVSMVQVTGTACP